MLIFLKNFLSWKEIVKIFDKVFTSDRHKTNTLEGDPQNCCLQKRMNESRNMFGTIISTGTVVRWELYIHMKSTF